MVGTYALSHGYYDAFYLKAQKVRTLLRREFEAAFAHCDALVTPTAPTTAFGIGEKSDDPMAMKLSDICTIPANIAGIPALSQCCGFDTQGLPIGLQLMGPAFSEETLSASPAPTKKPPTGTRAAITVNWSAGDAAVSNRWP